MLDTYTNQHFLAEQRLLRSCPVHKHAREEKPPTVAATTARQAGATKGAADIKVRARILAHITANPGASKKDIGAALHLRAATVFDYCKTLQKRGVIRFGTQMIKQHGKGRVVSTFFVVEGK